MTLGNYNDVCGPERARVMVGENVVGFPNDANFGFSAQYFFAVEVLGHGQVDYWEFAWEKRGLGVVLENALEFFWENGPEYPWNKGAGGRYHRLQLVEFQLQPSQGMPL